MTGLLSNLRNAALSEVTTGFTALTDPGPAHARGWKCFMTAAWALCGSHRHHRVKSTILSFRGRDSKHPPGCFSPQLDADYKVRSCHLEDCCTKLHRGSRWLSADVSWPYSASAPMWGQGSGQCSSWCVMGQSQLVWVWTVDMGGGFLLSTTSQTKNPTWILRCDDTHIVQSNSNDLFGYDVVATAGEVQRPGHRTLIVSIALLRTL